MTIRQKIKPFCLFRRVVSDYCGHCLSRCFVMFALSFFVVTDSFAVSVSDRMAGSLPVSEIGGQQKDGNQDKNTEDSDFDIKPAKKPRHDTEQAESTQPRNHNNFLRISDISESDIIRIDSLGVIDLHDKGFLGRDVWYGADRSKLIDSLNKTHGDIKSPVVTDLLIRLMLTQADAGLMKGYENVKSPELFALKLEKLLEMGRFRSASLMYSKLPDIVYDASLLEKGITAMIGSGEVAKACLEMYAFSDQYEDTDYQKDDNAGFMSDIVTLCRVYDKSIKMLFENESSRLIGKFADDKNYRITLDDAESFTNKYDNTEIAVAFALDRVDFVDASVVEFSELSPFVLGLVLDSGASVPEEWRFLATAEAIVRGERDIELVNEFFGDDYKFNSKSKSDHWFYDIHEIYNKLVNASFGEEQASFVYQAFDITPKRWHRILKPFIEFAVSSDAGAYISQPDKFVFLSSVILSFGERLPADWRDALIEITGLKKNDERNRMYASVILVADDLASNRSINESIKAFADYSENDEIAFTWAVSRHFSDAEASGDKKKSGYEKLNSLIFSDNYVMSDSGVLQELKKSMSGKSAGMMILYASNIISGTFPDDLYPVVASDIVESFRDVGLHNEARRFSVEAITSLIKQ